MTTLSRSTSPAAPTMDLSDSLDIRLIVAGRLSPTGVALRRDRAALAAVLGRGDRARTSGTATHLGRNAR
jgi:hypothetical protein